jgi:predicted small lipoprotein YifL
MIKNKIIVIISFLLFLSGCGVVKEGFKSPKQKTSDEFLVEKKSPLIMPPNFNELPVPKSSNQKNKKNDNTIEDLISKSENKILENKENTQQDLEKTILEKINE